jgi:hypothetical protein
MVLKLNGKVICDSNAVYKAENVDAATLTGGGMSPMISDMSICLTPVNVKKGDLLTMEANYDMLKHNSYVTPLFVINDTNIFQAQSSRGRHV